MREYGGPAFAAGAGSGEDLSWQAGMTLRDYFAGQALAGILANPEVVATLNDGDHRIGGWVADHAFSIADAMIAESSR